MTRLASRIRYFRFQSFDRTSVVQRRLQSLRAQSWLAGPPDPSTTNRLFVNSIPKAGTHLLRVALEGMPSMRDSGMFLSHLGHDGDQLRLTDSVSRLKRVRSGYFVSGHMPWSHDDGSLLESLGYRMLLLIRDPRDVLLSQIDHAVERSVNRFHRTLVLCPDGEARVKFMLEGGPLVDSALQALPFDAYLRSYVKWSDALIVRFEDLAGLRGGGDPDVQARTLRTIARYLEIDLSQNNLKTVVGQMGNAETPTLRKGKVERWKSELTPEMRRMANDSLGPLIDELGYRW